MIPRTQLQVLVIFVLLVISELRRTARAFKLANLVILEEMSLQLVFRESLEFTHGALDGITFTVIHQVAH